nr:hypothetical protein [Pleurocapsa sp. FMAR1]
MSFAKLGTVTFIKDKDNPLISQAPHRGFMAGLLDVVAQRRKPPQRATSLLDGGIEFLDGGHNQGIIPSHLLNELSGVVGAVYAVETKVIKFFAGLVIEVRGQ